MIYLFYGENSFKAKQKAREVTSALIAKKGEHGRFSLFEIDSDNFNIEETNWLINSHHLFGDKNLAVFKYILENEVAKDFCSENLPRLASSQNIFIFLEKETKENIFSEIKNLSTKSLEFKNPTKKETPKKTGIFLFTDAVAGKKRKEAWLAYQRLLISGENEEEIFWKIFWQIKNIALIYPHKDKDAETATNILKMHPFVAKKTLNFAKNFSREDLEDFSKKLIEIYENHRFSKVELNFGIENFILNL